ncbi:HNH endonuclease, partial [Sphingomonas sp. ABOLF]
MALAQAQAHAAATADAIAKRRESERARTALYRSRGGGAIPGWMRQQVFERDGFQCCDCGAEDRLECDHVVPVSKGGETTLENLQTLCKPCNARKRDRIRKSDQRGQTRTNSDTAGSPVDSADEPAPSPSPLSSPQT